MFEPPQFHLYTLTGTFHSYTLFHFTLRYLTQTNLHCIALYFQSFSVTFVWDKNTLWVVLTNPSVSVWSTVRIHHVKLHTKSYLLLVNSSLQFWRYNKAYVAMIGPHMFCHVTSQLRVPGKVHIWPKSPCSQGSGSGVTHVKQQTVAKPQQVQCCMCVCFVHSGKPQCILFFLPPHSSHLERSALLANIPLLSHTNSHTQTHTNNMPCGEAVPFHTVHHKQSAACFCLFFFFSAV